MMSDSEDESAVDRRTWEKMADSLHREGFREGMADGRHETFQKGFDQGFKVGFSSGSKLAYGNGFLRFVSEHKNLKNILEENQLWPPPCYSKPARGACVVCPSVDKDRFTREDMAQAIIPVDKPINAVIKEQEERIVRLVEKFDSVDEKMKRALSVGK